MVHDGRVVFAFVLSVGRFHSESLLDSVSAATRYHGRCRDFHDWVCTFLSVAKVKPMSPLSLWYI